MGQNSVVVYSQAIQAHLQAIVSPVPVFAAFNRNFSSTPKFVVWMLRDVHQPVYPGAQGNKGIDRPTFQISVFTQQTNDGFTISQQVLDSLHGYSGLFGGATYGIQIAKADVQWLYHSYNDDEKMAQVFLDCTLDIPT